MKKISYFLFEDKRSAILWLIIRLYVGLQWLQAGWGKLFSSSWIGSDAGKAITGFLNNALTKTGGEHPDVMGFYAWLIKNIFIPIAPLMSYLVVFGEILVGIALIIGFQTKKSAIIGSFMNFNYLFSGAVSINPLLLLLQIFIIIAYKVVDNIGIKRIFKK